MGGGSVVGKRPGTIWRFITYFIKMYQEGSDIKEKYGSIKHSSDTFRHFPCETLIFCSNLLPKQNSSHSSYCIVCYFTPIFPLESLQTVCRWTLPKYPKCKLDETKHLIIIQKIKIVTLSIRRRWHSHFSNNKYWNWLSFLDTDYSIRGRIMAKQEGESLKLS